MSLSTRAVSVADYVEQGRICLTSPPQGFRFDPALELAFIDKVNQERMSRNLEPLQIRTEMRPAARFHSLDMGINDFFGHESPDGRSHPARITAFDRTLIAAYTAENVAMEERVCEDRTGRVVICKGAQKVRSISTLDHIHNNLMNSPGHRANILSADATHIALGIARVGDSVYVTQLFADPAGLLDAPLPLRIEAGDQLTLLPHLDGWSFRRFAFVTGHVLTDLKRGLVPPSARGNVRLALRGERMGEVEVTPDQILQSVEFSYFNGPAAMIIAPKES
ncbi:MAG: hypothetical protein Hens3KO_10580 [Henriciella sp.]